MKWEVIVRPEAEMDLAEACAWYDERDEGLGDELLDRVGDLLISIGENPFQFPAIYRGVHRALTRKFPFEVFYILNEPRIMVLAIVHMRRDPAIWRSRL